MAESNRRSYSDPTTADGAPMSPRDRLDTLAELAKLLEQTLPMNNAARDARLPTLAGNRSACELLPIAQSYAASDQQITIPLVIDSARSESMVEEFAEGEMI
jgi:hypothetical protein